MNLRNTNDIKKEILQLSGELTDGTSAYDSIAVNYLNEGYKKIMAGGNIFGIDCSDPFPWATTKNPIILTLYPEFKSGSINMTLGSYNGTFSNIPVDSNGNQISVKGWYLKLTDFADFYFIRFHNAGTLNFQIDQKWTNQTTSGNFTVFPLEYDLVDNTIIIDELNNKLDFKEQAGTLVANLVQGVYSIADFCTMASSALSSAGTSTYNVTFNYQTRKFTVARAGGSPFSILAASGPNWEISGWPTLGFTMEDKTQNVASYSSDSVLNGIQRLPQAFNTYQNAAPVYVAPEDSGKIYGCDLPSMNKKFPLTQLLPFFPTKFAETNRRDNGIVRVRFNTYPTENMRVEVPYIPIPEILADNTSSVPRIQEAYRKFLVYFAAYFIANDKSDDKRDSFGEQAKAELQAMINDYRSNTERTNNTFGKLIPRPRDFRNWRTNWNV